MLLSNYVFGIFNSLFHLVTDMANCSTQIPHLTVFTCDFDDTITLGDTTSMVPALSRQCAGMEDSGDDEVEDNDELEQEWNILSENEVETEENEARENQIEGEREDIVEEEITLDNTPLAISSLNVVYSSENISADRFSAQVCSQQISNKIDGLNTIHRIRGRGDQHVEHEKEIETAWEADVESMFELSDDPSRRKSTKWKLGNSNTCGCISDYAKDPLNSIYTPSSILTENIFLQSVKQKNTPSLAPSQFLNIAIERPIKHLILDQKSSELQNSADDQGNSHSGNDYSDNSSATLISLSTVSHSKTHPFATLPIPVLGSTTEDLSSDSTRPRGNVYSYVGCTERERERVASSLSRRIRERRRVREGSSRGTCIIGHSESRVNSNLHTSYSNVDIVEEEDHESKKKANHGEDPSPPTHIQAIDASAASKEESRTAAQFNVSAHFQNQQAVGSTPTFSHSFNKLASSYTSELSRISSLYPNVARNVVQYSCIPQTGACDSGQKKIHSTLRAHCLLSDGASLPSFSSRSSPPSGNSPLSSPRSFSSFQAQNKTSFLDLPPPSRDLWEYVSDQYFQGLNKIVDSIEEYSRYSLAPITLGSPTHSRFLGKVQNKEKKDLAKSHSHTTAVNYNTDRNTKDDTYLEKTLSKESKQEIKPNKSSNASVSTVNNGHRKLRRDLIDPDAPEWAKNLISFLNVLAQYNKRASIPINIHGFVRGITVPGS